MFLVNFNPEYFLMLLPIVWEFYSPFVWIYKHTADFYIDVVAFDVTGISFVDYIGFSA